MQYRDGLRQMAETIRNTGAGISAVPIVEIAGDRRVLIENHCGVIAYGSDSISVKVKWGTICICGSGMEIAKMTREQLIISGAIDSVKLQRKGNT